MRLYRESDWRRHHQDSLDGGLSVYEISVLVLLAVATGVLLGMMMASVLAAVLWFLLMGALITLEALPEEERETAVLGQAESPVARRILFLVNAVYCVGAVSLAGLIALVINAIVG